VTELLKKLGTAPAAIRIASFVTVLLLLWLIVAVPLHALVRNPNQVSLIAMPVLYGLFLLMLRPWGRSVHHQPQLLRHYGMRQPKPWIYEWLGGLGIGYGIVLLLFELQGAMGWLRWFNPGRSVPQVLLEGLAIAAIIGLAEEILFRGWLLDELKRNLSPNLALAISSVIYALLHGMRLVPASLQWVALFLLGWTLGLSKRLTGDRLGMAAGLHAGLVWCYYVLKVGGFFRYTGTAPLWITGFENNPLAGALGILTMLGLVIGMTIGVKTSRHNQPKTP
jgi:uncharacterized protein